MTRFCRMPIACLLVGLIVSAASAQVAPVAEQVAAAVSPAPPEFQAGAAVLGYDADHRLVTLREGTNDLVCLADDPRDERFHVACYHRSMEPFMARGRALRAEGRSGDEIKQIRYDEIRAGAIALPEHPAMLYQYFGDAAGFDPETGTVQNGRRLTVIYMPYATVESTGLPASGPPGTPWLMDPGEPGAHVMLIHPEPAAPSGAAADDAR